MRKLISPISSFSMCLDRPAVARRLPDELGQDLLHGGGIRGDGLVAFLHAQRDGEQGSVLPAFHEVGVGWLLARLDLGLVHPLEVEAVEVTVPDAEQDPVLLEVVRMSRVGDGFTLHHLSHDHPPSFSVIRSSGCGQKNARPLTRITMTRPTIIRIETPRALPVNQIMGSPRRIAFARSRIRWPGSAREGAGGRPPRSCSRGRSSGIGRGRRGRACGTGSRRRGPRGSPPRCSRTACACR